MPIGNRLTCTGFQKLQKHEEDSAGVEFEKLALGAVYYCEICTNELNFRILVV